MSDPFSLTRTPPPAPAYVVENGHLPIVAGEVLEVRRPLNVWAWIAGTLGFLGFLAVGLAVRG